MSENNSTGFPKRTGDRTDRGRFYVLTGKDTYLSPVLTMADINPLRYRGYYYDTETGFYYLQSRYYDPVTHRFINADSYASTDSTDAIACNMFAYCGNNPVIWIDAEGNRPFVNTMMTDSGTGNAKRFSAVVLYYDTGNDFTEQATTQFAFASEYYSVKYIGISNAEELILAWGTWSSTTDVYMYFHGGNERLYFQGESVTAEELTGANITKSIYLFACNGDEIAKKLASNNNCKVVACAVGVSYDYIDGMAYPHAGTRLNNILFGPKWEWYITYPSGNKSQMIGNSICYIE